MSFDYEVLDARDHVLGWVSLSDADASYVLPDGRRCPMLQVFGWCDDCRGPVAAEEVPSAEEIETAIAAAHAGPEPYRAFLATRGEGVPPWFMTGKLKWFVKYDLERGC